jgi:glucose dehydrogenase
VLHLAIRAVAFTTAMLATEAPGLAADVTPERLRNPDREPQNWLMNHRTYDGQRFSPLARINKDNVKDLKLAYAVALGTTGGEWIEAPLVENGFIYITDSWGVLYKIDARRATPGGARGDRSLARHRCRAVRSPAPDSVPRHPDKRSAHAPDRSRAPVWCRRFRRQCLQNERAVR